MTISPPAKVKPNTATLYTYETLASGIDTLNLAVDVLWPNEDFIKNLEEWKKYSQDKGLDMPFNLFFPHTDKELWNFVIKPFGVSGYPFFIQNKHYALKIDKTLGPVSRPNVLIEIRSEALWQFTPFYAVEIILDFIRQMGGYVESAKTSRVDLCLDLHVPSNFKGIELILYATTRATYMALHLSHKYFSGLSIGKGDISARIYDKTLEIKQQSKKFWMFNIWGFEEIPRNLRVMRIEFQLRREAIRQMGIDQVDELLNHADNLWAYCTKKWLKFQDNPGKHHTQKKTFDWWKIVQNTFLGVSDPEPLIRCKALSTEKTYHYRQTMGALTSYAAIEEDNENCERKFRLKEFMSDPSSLAQILNRDEFEIRQRIDEKKMRNHRLNEKMLEAHGLRKSQGFPSKLPHQPNKD